MRLITMLAMGMLSGPSKPVPPSGFVFVLRDDGSYVIYDDGTYKIVEAI